jgi:hypothetical protein
LVEAVRYHWLAAEQAHANVQSNLGTCFVLCLAAKDARASRLASQRSHCSASARGARYAP